MPPHAELALNGVEVFMNASGSHHQLRKLDLRLRAFIGATHTRGGVYIYSNHQGCDGGRLYYGGQHDLGLFPYSQTFYLFLCISCIDLDITANLTIFNVTGCSSFNLNLIALRIAMKQLFTRFSILCTVYCQTVHFLLFCYQFQVIYDLNWSRLLKLATPFLLKSK